MVKYKPSQTLNFGIVTKFTLIYYKKRVNQWRNMQVVITWFKNIKSKSSRSFIKLNIVGIYPSISKELLLKAISFGKSVAHIQDKFIETILHSRKAVLFNKNDVWVKKR